MALLGNMQASFSNWDVFSHNVAWEIVYVNRASGVVIRRRQVCKVNEKKKDVAKKKDAGDEQKPPKDGAEEGANEVGPETQRALQLCDRADQCQVSLDDSTLANLIIAVEKDKEPEASGSEA
ncbi:hypothetical protein ERJ75_001549500 [Trypanosoma vivax]|nr:hypothetical protein ERJ75_001549500 [Trypanosoma vivax]